LTEPRVFCADLSREDDEPLAATASRIDHWFLVEHRGLWTRDALRERPLRPGEAASTKAGCVGTARRLLFVRRPDRRRHRSSSRSPPPRGPAKRE
jgi:hypothetical protein